MKNNVRKTTAVLFATLFLSVSAAFAQTTEFTYQGSLQNGATAANGNYDFEFLLFDSLSGGAQQGSTLTCSTVAVSAGAFAVKLDFGSQFPGANRYLEIHVRPSGGGAFTPLTPRQLVNSSPYSLKSLAADTATNATNSANAVNAATASNALQLGGVAANQFVLTGDARLSDARAPTAGSSSYVQNTTSPQASSNFNISGTGKAGTFDAATQYNIGGFRALSVAGNANTFVGLGTGQSNTTGFQNSFMGANAGNSNTTGGNNSFFGEASGFSNNAGLENSFVGFTAGFSNTSGNDNSFVGRNAGGSNTTGGSNTAIGAFANVGSGGLTNATAIGANAVVSQSNSLVLGNNANVGIGTASPNAKLQIAGGSVYIQNPNSLVITSPNGACWFITVGNTGTVSTISVTCP